MQTRSRPSPAPLVALATILGCGCGCGPDHAATLADLQGISLSITEHQARDGTIEIVASIDYASARTADGCAILDGATATLDGAPFTTIDPGEWKPANSLAGMVSPQCRRPSFRTRRAAAAPVGGGVVVSDGTARLSVSLPGLGLRRAVALSVDGRGDGTLHSGDRARLAYTSDAPEAVSATAADLVLTSDGSCPGASVLGDLPLPTVALGADVFTVDVPDLTQPNTIRFACPRTPAPNPGARLAGSLTAQFTASEPVSACLGPDRCRAAWQGELSFGLVVVP